MGADIKDVRKYLRDVDEKKAAQTPPEPLLEQTATDKANTGDERLDKFIRIIESKKVAVEAEYTLLAKQGIAAPEDRVFRTYQIQASFDAGYMKALVDMQDIPAKILMEERPSLTIH